MRHGRRAVTRSLPLVLYCALIYVLSSLPDPGTPDLKFVWGDKLVHAGAYGLMAVLALRAFAARSRDVRSAMVGALLFCTLYGAVDELHQSLVPGRDADVFDWLADSVGAALTLAFLAWIVARPRAWTRRLRRLVYPFDATEGEQR